MILPTQMTLKEFLANSELRELWGNDEIIVRVSGIVYPIEGFFPVRGGFDACYHNSRGVVVANKIGGNKLVNVSKKP